MNILFYNPPTGDSGLSPIITVLIAICLTIIIGCIIWTVIINKKEKHHTTVITVKETDETEQTIIEDITSEDK